jgi:hypothetical protein
LNECIHVLNAYIDQVNHMYPPIAETDHGAVQDDSQDSLDMCIFAANWERSELILVSLENDWLYFAAQS